MTPELLLRFAGFFGVRQDSEDRDHWTLTLDQAPWGMPGNIADIAVVRSTTSPLLECEFNEQTHSIEVLVKLNLDGIQSATLVVLPLSEVDVDDETRTAALNVTGLRFVRPEIIDGAHRSRVLGKLGAGRSATAIGTRRRGGGP